MLKRLFGATEGASASSGSSGGAGTSNAGRQSAIETLANLKETPAEMWGASTPMPSTVMPITRASAVAGVRGWRACESGNAVQDQIALALLSLPSESKHALQVMDEINEHTDNMRAVNDALAEPFGISADFDEAELDAELNELEALELDQALLQVRESCLFALPALPSVSASGRHSSVVAMDQHQHQHLRVSVSAEGATRVSHTRS
jgi:hypothetical protein